MMNCPNCNKPLLPNQRFCPSCGTKVEQLTTGVRQAENLWQPQEVQPEPPQAEWRPQEVQPEPPQAEWRPQEVQPEPAQAEWRPQEVQPEPAQAEWRPQEVQPEPPQVTPPQKQPAYQPPQSGQNDRYAAQFQQYQQPSRFANPKHAQGSEVFSNSKKKKDKK